MANEVAVILFGGSVKYSPGPMKTNDKSLVLGYNIFNPIYLALHNEGNLLRRGLALQELVPYYVQGHSHFL